LEVSRIIIVQVISQFVLVKGMEVSGIIIVQQKVQFVLVKGIEVSRKSLFRRFHSCLF